MMIKEVSTMELKFAIATVAEIAASTLLVLGFIYENKLIALEEAIETRVARWIAKRIKIRRKRK